MDRMLVPIDVITYTDFDGRMKPLRFRVVDKTGETTIINVNRIKSIDIQVIKRAKVNVYICECIVDGFVRDYKLKFYRSDTNWTLTIV